jgi:hypothetical protein
MTILSMVEPSEGARMLHVRRRELITRSLRTGCDAPLQSVHPGRSACLSLHVRLAASMSSRLPSGRLPAGASAHAAD